MVRSRPRMVAVCTVPSALATVAVPASPRVSQVASTQPSAITTPEPRRSPVAVAAKTATTAGAARAASTATGVEALAPEQGRSPEPSRPLSARVPVATSAPVAPAASISHQSRAAPGGRAGGGRAGPGRQLRRVDPQPVERIRGRSVRPVVAGILERHGCELYRRARAARPRPRSSRSGATVERPRFRPPSGGTAASRTVGGVSGPPTRPSTPHRRPWRRRRHPDRAHPWPAPGDRRAEWATTPRSGAVVTFLGVVRDHADGRDGRHRALLRGLRGGSRRAARRGRRRGPEPLARARADRARAPARRPRALRGVGARRRLRTAPRRRVRRRPASASTP